jgi:PTH1 family peptidyl-tRNA hydrolase
MADYVIAGLGNPGNEHADDRHNVGFWVVDRLARRHGIRLHGSRTATIGEGTIEDANIVLVKPRTFVNRSGSAIAPLLKRHGVPVENLIVAYDELDLPEARIRVRRKGGSGGHNGLRSIIASVGSGDFGRVRVGIGRPYANGVPTWDPDVVMRYVLSGPSKPGREALDDAVERACDAIEAIIRDGWERTMEAANRVE